MREHDLTRRHEMTELALALNRLLEAGLDTKWPDLERPTPVALLYWLANKDKMDVRSHDFECLCDAYVGLAVEQWVQPYLSLHAALTQQGATSQATGHNFAIDTYVWAAADRTLPEEPLGIDGLDDLDDDPLSERRAKAMVLQTQSCNFLVLLNERFGRWTLHFRKFWPDVRDALAQGNVGGSLSTVVDRKDLTVLDVVKLSSAAAEFGDDLPGVHYPRRPHLATLLNGSLLVGDQDAGIGLRYGDMRDMGYVMSMHANGDLVEAKDMMYGPGGYADVAFIGYNMAAAIDCLAATSA
jgi:hypothetical protein